MIRVMPLCLPVLAVATMASAASRDVTFNKDVLLILQNRCQECHRPGEIGKMPLLTYQQVRPWAAAIKESVLLKKMPPWFADPHFGKFSNDRSLNKEQMETVSAWVDQGAKPGSAKDAPAPRKFVDGWNIPTPDLVIQMPTPFSVPASGEVE